MTRLPQDNLVHLLEECIEKCGATLRRESLLGGDGVSATRGGLCRIGEKKFVFVDPRAPLPERISVLASALAGLDTGDVFLPPLIREIVERAAARTGPSGLGEEPLSTCVCAEFALVSTRGRD